jgi:hypothetical protein
LDIHCCWRATKCKIIISILSFFNMKSEDIIYIIF